VRYLWPRQAERYSEEGVVGDVIQCFVKYDAKSDGILEDVGDAG
jgi:hypothetical protein